MSETLAPGRNAVWSHTGELGVTTIFSFLPLYPLRDSSTRFYGKAESLDDGNLVYSLAQELTVALYRIKEPETTFALVGTAYWEDSTDPDDLNYAVAPADEWTSYFRPDEALSVDGGLRISSWIPVGDGVVLGITARGSGGLQIEQLTTSPVRRAKVDGELDIELGLGESSLSVGAHAGRTYGISGGGDDYWSVSLRLGFTARLPRLLAP